MSDLSKQDLGNGSTLVFQRNPTSGEVRAVVKDPAGAIIVRGPVVAEKDAEISRQKAAMDFLFFVGAEDDESDNLDDPEDDDGDEEEDE